MVQMGKTVAIHKVIPITMVLMVKMVETKVIPTITVLVVTIKATLIMVEI